MDALKKAQQKYSLKRVNKSVSFNSETEQDLIEFAEQLDFSNWVKAKIKGDIEADKFRRNLEKNT